MEISKEKLESYFKSGKTGKEIARILGVTPATVSYHAKKLGVETKVKKELPTKERLTKLYNEEGLSLTKICSMYNISMERIKGLFNTYDLKTREAGSNQYKKVDYEHVKRVFNEEGYTLLSEKYKNQNEKMEFVCPNGHKWSISFVSFKSGKRCGLCANSKRNENRKHSYQFVKKTFESKGCILISDSYKNSHQKLEYICHCGCLTSMSFSNFKSGYGCVNCKRLRFTGSNNHNYNPNLSEYDRLGLGRYEEGYKSFRVKVFIRDSYKCIVCEQDKRKLLVAHHLESYSDNVHLRTEVSNAVTLCVSCHKKFHSVYGYGNNTKKQFEEFREVGTC